jgi:hypothetical protein
MQKISGLLFLVLVMLSHFAFSQKADSVKNIFHFSGSVLVTNNGISVIPTFSLGKPATIFNLSMGSRKLSFEPELRFSLEGKPWSFLFWTRYKLYESEKFRIKIGAHPALNFKTMTVPKNGLSNEVLVTRRYLAGELSPNYAVAKNISIGLYYLYSRGLDEGTAKNTHFLTLNSNFSDIRMPGSFFIKFNPQLYYLKMDDRDGFYVAATMTLSRRNWPLSVAAIMNKTIQTDIAASKNFVWNLSLIYSFGDKYVKN